MEKCLDRRDAYKLDDRTAARCPYYGGDREPKYEEAWKHKVLE